jgi:hypothetical protein
MSKLPNIRRSHIPIEKSFGMAIIKILLQGLEQDDDHDTAVNQLLSLPDMTHYLFSLAFSSRNGVERLSTKLDEISDKLTIFLGIRNGVTSIQSIFSLLRIGIYPYIIDTATNARIFHPKIYAAYNDEAAHIILGSANLTNGGLGANIEASSSMTLDRGLPTDETSLLKLVNTLTSLPNRFPDHVYQINSAKHAVHLLREGRVEDERISRLPSTNRLHKGRERDTLGPIPTYVKKATQPQHVKEKRSHSRPARSAVSFVSTLVWESKPLTQRSLNIPQGSNTNITGDANLGQGLMDDINFQRYFRDEVFSDLDWYTDPTSKSPHLERALINAEIIIKRISYDHWQLEVTHDPRTDTASYEQRNVMTKIKWGEARSLIARRDLLDRTLSLHKITGTDFRIVID